MMMRPARKQRDGPEYTEKAHDGLFNIWYSRNTDYSSAEERREAKLAGPSYKINVKEDTGFTRAIERSYHCIYFAHGRCYRGSDCVFFHRIPLEEDERNSDSMRDIFGRERHATDREDMGGVGNFNRESRTLFLSSLKMMPNLDQIIYKHFSQFGEITYLKVVEEKSVAFVQYALRCCAEFAKEAMTDKALDEDEILNVRWASEDPKVGASDEEKEANPAKKSMEEKRAKAWEGMKATNPQYFSHYETLHRDGEYPDTDEQYKPAKKPQVSQKEQDYYAQYTQSISGVAQQPTQPQQQQAMDPRYTQYYQQYAQYYQQAYPQYYAQGTQPTQQTEQGEEVREPVNKKRRFE